MQSVLGMKNYYLLCLTLCACGSPPLFVTPCGLEVVGPIPDENAGSKDAYHQTRGFEDRRWNVDDVTATEGEIIREYSAVGEADQLGGDHSVGDYRFIKACEAIRGFRVHIRPEIHWSDAFNRGSIDGLTDCAGGELWVGNVPPDYGALGHELAHVIQRCHPNGPDDGNDLDHKGWKAQGIIQAYERAKNHPR